MRGWEGGKCLICAKQFSSTNNARRHFNEMHEGANQKFDCPICGKKFKQFRYVKKHMTYNHSDVISMDQNIDSSF